MKVKCPRHEDIDPSCEVYPEHGFCFAGCGVIPLNELNVAIDATPKTREVENLEKKYEYICQLPQGDFRGFVFPFDSTGFYICWPSSYYYKQRLFAADAKPKYRGPRGHTPPPYWARKENQQSLLVCEGELEALSAAVAMPHWDVVSPGSTSNFTDRSLLTQCLNYGKVIIAVDNDGAGLKAARNLTELLMYKIPYVMRLYKSVESDFNDILQKDGITAVREEIERLSQTVQR